MKGKESENKRTGKQVKEPCKERMGTLSFNWCGVAL